MVGDHPTADIAGAAACGLMTAWVSHRQAWPDGAPEPDLRAPDAASLLAAIAAGAPPAMG